MRVRVEEPCRRGLRVGELYRDRDVCQVGEH